VISFYASPAALTALPARSALADLPPGVDDWGPHDQLSVEIVAVPEALCS